MRDNDCTAEQFDRLRANRQRRRAPQPIDAAPVLRELARAQRGLDDATEAWDAMAPPALREAVKVLGVDDGFVRFGVPSPTVGYCLRRWWQSKGGEAFRRAVRGVTKIVVEVR